MTEPTATDHLDALEALARDRRSSLRVDPDRPVDPELVERLVQLAATAPNHKKTYPWRFRVVTGDARSALGEALARDLIDAGEESPGKISKARVKYRRAPVVLVVAAAAGEHEVMTEENRDAVAASIQTLLLGATAAGLASYWGSPPLNGSKRVLALAGFESDVHIVGAIYLGWPTSTVAVPPRPAPTVTLIDT